jgi:tetratricopeptide (TPR) repeat protein
MIGRIKNALVRFFQPITSSQYFAGIRDFNNGNYKEAAERFDLIKKGVYNTSILYGKLTDFYYHRALRNRALVDFYNEDFLQCIINCKRALELDPHDRVSLNYLAHSFHHVGQYSAAIKNLRELMTLENERIDVFFNLAKLLVKADQMKEAIKILDQLIKENSKYADFFLIRGIAYSKLGNVEKSIENYRSAIDINPTLAKGLLLLGLEYIREFRYEAALDVFKQGVNSCPRDTELVFYYGLVKNIIAMLQEVDLLEKMNLNALESEKLPESLINDLTYLDDRAVSERLNNLDLDISYGEHFKFLDPIYDKACLQKLISVFKKMVKEVPEYADYKYKLATFYIKLSDLENAKFYLQESLLINPDYTDALVALLKVYENMQDLEAADRISTKILALNPEVGENHLNHGRIMLKMERFEEAVGSMNTARMLDSRFNSHLYLLGFILKENGIFSLARAAWNSVKRVYPNLHKELAKLDRQEQRMAKKST